jgi:6-phosphofructokinase 1
VNQRLGYIVRCGDPDSLDSIVPMAFGNIALDLILSGTSGRRVALRNGCYTDVPLEVVKEWKEVVDGERYYSPERLRPQYRTFESRSLFIVAGGV